MEKIRVKEILIACGGILVFGDKNAQVSGISIDSRNIKKGEIFLAIKGKNYDGHNFIGKAFRKGALGAIVGNGTKIPGKFEKKIVIKVNSTAQALMDIADFYKSKFGCIMIGITGSNGKTTTKEMTAFILSDKFDVLKSEGSFNNEIGVPLTLLKMEKKHKAAVIELGTNHSGEIRILTNIIEPDIAAITNIGTAHTEFLKNKNGILREKSALLERLEKKGMAVINADDKLLKKFSKKLKCGVLTFGIKNKSDVRAEKISCFREGKKEGYEFTLCIGKNKTKTRLNITGIHNIYNVLCASAIAFAAGMNIKPISAAISKYRNNVKGRFNIYEKKNGIRIIDDSYNANPSSVKSALATFDGMSCCGKKIAVLGDMKELGRCAGREHEKIGRFVGCTTVDILLTFGKTAKKMKYARKNGKIAKNYLSKKRLIKDLRKIIKPGDAVLIKGSRAMKMEEIVKSLLKG